MKLLKTFKLGMVGILAGLAMNEANGTSVAPNPYELQVLKVNTSSTRLHFGKRTRYDYDQVLKYTIVVESSLRLNLVTGRIDQIEVKDGKFGIVGAQLCLPADLLKMVKAEVDLGVCASPIRKITCKTPAHYVEPSYATIELPMVKLDLKQQSCASNQNLKICGQAENLRVILDKISTNRSQLSCEKK